MTHRHLLCFTGKLSSHQYLYLYLFLFLTSLPNVVSAQESLFPQIPGWSLHREDQVYDSNNLWDIIDGAADLYLEYNFVDLHIARYSSGGIEIKAELYKHGSPTDAFGIYSQERDPGYRYISIGTEGYIAESVLNFLSGPYYVKLSSNQKGAEVQAAITMIAGKLNDDLKQEKAFPKEFLLFPEEEKNPNSEKYVSQNFLGYSFLKSVFTVMYGKENSFTAFVIPSADESTAQKVLSDFLSVQTGSNYSQTGKNRYEVGNSSNGTIVLGISSRFIYGLINCRDRVKGSHYLDEIEKKINK